MTLVYRAYSPSRRRAGPPFSDRARATSQAGLVSWHKTPPTSLEKEEPSDGLVQG